jgi:hypothetical protein
MNFMWSTKTASKVKTCKMKVGFSLLPVDWFPRSNISCQTYEVHLNTTKNGTYV